MPLLTQSPTQFQTSLQNALVGAVSALKKLNFTPGSNFGAIINAITSQLLFIQQQMVYQVSVTRAATSVGQDLTNFVADYLLTPSRLAALSAQGQVTFGKYVASAANITVPIGTIVQTAVQPPTVPVQYVVVADTTNPNYNASTQVYTLVAGQTSMSVTCAAVVAGTAGNVTPGSLSVLVTPGIGIDYVTNAVAIANGVNQETDAALRLRFQNYISGLATSNTSAISAAVASTLVGLTFTVNDQLNASNVSTPACFTVVVDDGSGAISSARLAAILAAVNLVRAAGSQPFVIAPTNVPITIAVTGTVIQAGFTPSVVRAAIAAALVAYVNANGVGGSGTNALSFVGIAGVVAGFIGSASGQGLASYASITVNGGTTNVTISNYQLARTSTSSVTVS